MFLEEETGNMLVCVFTCACVCICVWEVFTDRVNVKVWGVFNKRSWLVKAGSA